MNIEFVERKAIKSSKKRSSKYKPLLKALDELEEGGEAVKINYEDEKEVKSMRTAVYKYNKKNGVKIKSSKDTENSHIYFYRD